MGFFFMSPFPSFFVEKGELLIWPSCFYHHAIKFTTQLSAMFEASWEVDGRKKEGAAEVAFAVSENC